MKVLLDVLTKPDLMERGITPGLKPVAAPVWADCANVFFRDGAVRKGAGFTDLVKSTETIRAITQASTASGDRAFLGTDGSLKVWDGTSLTRVGSGYTVNAHWSMLSYGNHFLATNGVEGLQYYDGVSANTIPSTTFAWAKILTKRGPHVLAANTSEGNTRINWCAADDVNTWEALADNSARGYTVRDLDSEIVACADLGTANAFYTQNSMVIAAYSGPPYYFNISKALSGIGANSLNAVVSVGRRNFGFSPKGVWATDGSSFEYVDGPMVKDWIRKNVDFEAVGGIVGYHNDVQSSVIWHFTLKDGTFGGLGFNYATSSWTHLDYQVTAASAKDVFEYPLLGLDLRLVEGEHGLNNGVVGQSASITSKPSACSAPTLYKILQAVQFHYDGTGAEYRIGLQLHVDDTVEWLDWRPLTQMDFITPREAAYFTLQIRSTGIDADWQLFGFAFHGETGGSVL